MTLAQTLTSFPGRSEKPESNADGSPLFALFAAMDKAGIGYCVLHGYESFPVVKPGDIDCIIDRAVSRQQLRRFLQATCNTHGWHLLEHNSYYAAIACRDFSGALQILNLDFSTDCDTGGRVSFSGEEVLAGRVWTGRFWVPAPDVRFNAYLIRCILKRSLDEERMATLSVLYRGDPAKCRPIMARFWTDGQAGAICQSLAANDFAKLRGLLPHLRAHIANRLLRQAPVPFTTNALRSFAAMIGRFFRPRGLQVVLLGQDGAGKSSVIAALETGLTEVFASVQVRGFAPPLHRIVKRGPVKTDTPHALAARSPFVSMLRASYWFAYDCYSRLASGWHMRRNRLVLYDRHFIDILIDPVRYRYGGPQWLPSLMARFMQKPDMVILLDAPAMVLHLRKPELAMPERERQRVAYLAVVKNRDDSHVVNANQPFDVVLRNVEETILVRLAARSASRA